MFARRNFLYKRSHIGAHHGLAARANTPSSLDDNEDTPSPSLSASSAAKTTNVPTSLTSVVSVPTTTVTPTTSSSSTNSPSSTPATSSPSSSSSSPSSSTSKSSTPASSSSTPTASSIVSTPLTLASTPTTHATSVSTRAVTSTLLTPTSSLSPSTTSSAGSSGGTSTGAIIGGVAGALAGIAALGFLLMWCMRRQRSRDIDDFDAMAFKRQSAVLVDEPVEPPRSYNPRPPTMIERHNASPALAAQAGYGGQNIYGSYGGYGQQPPNAPSEMIQPVGTPPPQAYGAPPMGYASYNDPQQQLSGQSSNMGYSGYDSQQQLVRQPSNAAFLTRQPSYVPGYAPPPDSLDLNTHYIDLNRSSVSPYQAAQYADISRQLGTTDPNGQVPREPSELPEGPLPSPFDDPVGATPAPDATSPHPSNVAVPGPVPATRAPQTQGNATDAHQRPGTLYDEGDAYGGI